MSWPPLAYIDPGTGSTVVGFLGWLGALLAALFGVLAVYFRKVWQYLKLFGSWLKRNYKISIPLLVVIVVTLTIGVHLMASQSTKIGKRIIVLGYDGISPRLVEPMMKEGLLPNMARLAANGTYSHLATTNPPQSPVAWSGFATGKNGGKSGIFDFIHRDPETYTPYLSLTRLKGTSAEYALKTQKFWHYTSDKNINTIILGCPVTFPAEKVHGKMLSGMGTPDLLGTQSTYTYFTSDDSSENRQNPHVQLLAKRDINVAHVYGPRVARFTGGAEKIKVPLKIQKKENGLLLTLQQKEIQIKNKGWSDWVELEFKVNFFKTMHGIVKFYLAESESEIKLYMTPVNLNPRKQAFSISYPESYAAELADKFGLFYTLGLPMDTNAMNDGVLDEEPFIYQANEILHRNKDSLFYELDRLDDGILYQYFESPDIIQHMFWRYTDEKHPMYEKHDKYKDTIKNWYITLDNLLGEVMARLQENDVLIMLSDHGFTTFRRAAHINSWLRANGYQALKNPTLTESENLNDVDWAKTKAYAVGFGGIYLNLQGREKEGIVKPAEAEVLQKEIADKISKWQDNGVNFVHKARVRKEAFWGEQAHTSPDVYVGFIEGYRASWQTALGGGPEVLVEDNLKKWSGTHLIDPERIPGVIYTNLKISPADPGLFDLAPTILELSGFSAEEIKAYDFDGKSMMKNQTAPVAF